MDGMNPITRKEMFLAAAGGQNVEIPTPVTREEFFLDEIAKGGGGSSLPSTETASAGDVLSLDDNKEPQWAAPSGSGGGVLVVHDVDGTLDKTWQEIADAGFAILSIEKDIGITCRINHSDGYNVTFAMFLPNGSGFDDPIGYTTSTASGYPVMQ